MMRVLTRDTNNRLNVLTVLGAMASENQIWLWELAGNTGADSKYPDTITTFNRVIKLDSQEQAEAYVIELYKEEKVNLSFTTCYGKDEWNELSASTSVETQEVIAFEYW